MEKLEPGFTYHIYNQGNNQESLFKETMNYEFFLSKVEKYFKDHFDIYAYCLLNNHFHMVLRVKEKTDANSASKALSNCFNSYAKAINKKYSRSGSLFRDRFRRKKINEENYLKNVIAYVSSNAVHHGFRDSIIEWPWSSYHDMIENKKSFIEKEFVLELFDGIENYKLFSSQKEINLEELE